MLPPRRNSVDVVDADKKPEWWRGRFLTPEDIHILNALPAADAKSFECLLQVQGRSDKRYRDQTIPLEQIIVS